MPDTLYRTNDTDRLDLICWRVYGHLDKTVETVLAHNPGLADLGPDLPMGVEIKLPEIARRTAGQGRPLWL
jgi:phage tail protein X